MALTPGERQCRAAGRGPADEPGLETIGVRLTTLSPKQADYIGVPVEGPFKPETYRY